MSTGEAPRPCQAHPSRRVPAGPPARRDLVWLGGQQLAEGPWGTRVCRLLWGHLSTLLLPGQTAGPPAQRGWAQTAAEGERGPGGPGCGRGSQTRWF